MRVHSIEAIPIEVPLGKNFGGSTYTVLTRCAVITRMRTDDGLVSEVYNGDNREHGRQVVRLIHDELAPRVKGMSLFEGERIWEVLFALTHAGRDRKTLLEAIACVDCSLWDLVGKALGKSVCVLLGGYRTSLPIISIGGYYVEGKTHADIGRELETYRRAGPRGRRADGAPRRATDRPAPARRGAAWHLCRVLRRPRARSGVAGDVGEPSPDQGWDDGGRVRPGLRLDPRRGHDPEISRRLGQRSSSAWRRSEEERKLLRRLRRHAEKGAQGRGVGGRIGGSRDVEAGHEVAPAEQLSSERCPIGDLDGEVGKLEDPLVGAPESLPIGGRHQLRCPVHLVGDHQHLLIEREGRPSLGREAGVLAHLREVLLPR